MTKHVTLGGDRRISRLGFGAMRLPARSWDGPRGDREAALAVLRRAVELGVDHIDTAAFYSYEDLSSNELIRTALRPYPEDLVIATKVGPRRGPGGWLPEAGPGDLRAAVEENLTGLGRDHLDLVYLRVGLMGTSEEPIGERFAVLAALREEGLIRHLGLSNVTAKQFAEARDIAPVVAVQNHFHLTRQDDLDLLAECEREGIAYVPFFPLGGFGLPDDGRIRRIADRHGATVAQVMLAWLLARSPVTLAIPGTSSLAHLAENMAAADLVLDEREVTELNTLGLQQG
ncbi:oxidoreductase [Streptosporangium sp. NPDC020072]|uniref:oxidoreductase n=1 Tax=Streptosporangium sp. NPDC020072 TaxID=3154788 RepID=UPI00344A22BE